MKPEAQVACGNSAPRCSAIIEDDLTEDEVQRVHRFGECWIRSYDQFSRIHWERALWLFAWERPVVWNDLRMTVPIGKPNPTADRMANEKGEKE